MIQDVILDVKTKILSVFLDSFSFMGTLLPRRKNPQNLAHIVPPASLKIEIMPNIREISSCIVRATHNSPKKIHLTAWDLKLLLLDPIQKGLLYHIPTKQNAQNFLDQLKNSLSRTLGFFPPLAGRLATVDHVETNTLSFYINCDNEGAQFTHSVAAGITVDDILQSKYVPEIVNSFFLQNGVSNIEGTSIPLLAVQVTELEDGYFVGCTMNHSVGDGTSFWNFLNSWSEISRGFDVPSKIPTMDRWFPEEQDCPIRVPVLDEKSCDEFVPPQLEERVFRFSKEKISELKQRANSDQTNLNISSLQAVLAHIWRSVTRCRYMGTDDGRQLALTLIADARRRLAPPLPDSYFGNAVNGVFVTTTAGALLNSGHGWASAQLNRAVATQTGEEIKNSYEKWAKCPVMYGRSVTRRNDVLRVSSSPRFDVYGNDFGWGPPLAVRSGPASKSDGKISLFPGPEPGSMDLEICLLEGTFRLLETDVEFKEFVQV